MDRVMNFSTEEARLIVLALERLRKEIDVDGESKMNGMNEGQKRACRFTLPFVDDLIDKLGTGPRKPPGGTPDVDQ